MLCMMDKREVIILSSDDEGDTQQIETNKSIVSTEPSSSGTLITVSNNSGAVTGESPSMRPNPGKRKLSSDQNSENNVGVSHKVCKLSSNDESQSVPEFVDLVDCSDKSDTQGNESQLDHWMEQKTAQKSTDHVDLIEIDEEDELNNSPPHQTPEGCHEANKAQRNLEKIKTFKGGNRKESEIGNESLPFFTEFVKYCGSLEKSPSDRAKLSKKLMQVYAEAQPTYIRTEEFRDFINMCRHKVSSDNLYLVAGTVVDDLMFRKKIKITSLEPTGKKAGKKGERRSEKSHERVDSPEVTAETNEKLLRKRTEYINKIIEKLNNLGNKIRELEEEEVDLSDEEDSSYILLQRYRERFCQIYNKLCEHTNVVPDANRHCNRKIHFNGSKYPAINRCIEAWLNKTKTFPDFADIMKLLETQGPSLGLPSNKEALRMLAFEIFQEVGTMLQRRRRYDLWDSFSEFLGDHRDPAEKNPALEKILNKNYENRIKKEQEIIQYYSELQDRERLEPEEVPEEEANQSPLDSGSEGEMEVEKIESYFHNRLDIAEDDNDDDDSSEKDGSDESKSEEASRREAAVMKESKNNFKNCKSLKWRSANAGKPRSESVGSRARADEGKEPENEDSEGKSSEKSSRGEEGKKDSEVEVLSVEDDNPGTAGSSRGRSPAKRSSGSRSPERKDWGPGRSSGSRSPERKDWGPGRSSGSRSPERKDWDPVGNSSAGKSCEAAETSNPVKELGGNDQDECPKFNGSFEARYCHIVTENPFEEPARQGTGWEKKKVFRDLTNVSRLMEKNRRSRRLSGLSPSITHQSFREFEKSSWKRKFRVSYRLSWPREEKCALSQEGKAGKSFGSSAGGGSYKKGGQNASEGGGDERGFYSGQGGESHDGGDEDKNRRNERTKDDLGDGKPEEEEEEEEEDDDTEDEDELGGEKGSGEKTKEQSKDSGNPVEEAVDPRSSSHAERKDRKGRNEEEEMGAEERGSEHEEMTEKEREDEEEETGEREWGYGSNVKIKEEIELEESDMGENEGEEQMGEGEWGYEGQVNIKVEKEDEPEAGDDEGRYEEHMGAKGWGYEGLVKIKVEKEDEPETGDDEGRYEEHMGAKGWGYEGQVKIKIEKEDEEPEMGENERGNEEHMGAKGWGYDGLVKIKEEKEDEEQETGEDERGDEQQMGEKEREDENERRESEDREMIEGQNEYNEQTETEEESEDNIVTERGNGNEEMIVSESGNEEQEPKEKEKEKEEAKAEKKRGGRNEKPKRVKRKSVAAAGKSRRSEEGGKRTRRGVQCKAEECVRTLRRTRSMPTGSSRIAAAIQEEILLQEQIGARKERRLNLSSWNTDIFVGKIPRKEGEEELKPLRERKRNGSTRKMEEVKISKKEPPPWKTQPSQFLTTATAPRPSSEDEERVKRFLLHSPSSISITPPRSLGSKPPSQATMQALATLRSLKGISTTVVKAGKAKSEEEVTVIGGSTKREEEQKSPGRGKRRRGDDLPVISSVQSMYSPPKVITIGEAVPPQEPSSTYCEKHDCETSSIKISNVWGNLPISFMQSMPDISAIPGCSSYDPQQTNIFPLYVLKKKNPKKKIEYVVID